MIIALINLVLNPFCVLFFIIFASSNNKRYFIPDGTNTHKLKPLPYFTFVALYLVVLLGATFLWTYYSSADFTIWEVYTPRTYWVSIPVWLVTGFTLSTYFKGMEGNIMGFIFFPLLLMASFALIAVNFMSIFSNSWSFNLPVIEYNFWLLFVLHAFSPIYVLLSLNTSNSLEKQQMDWISPMITSIILQLFFFGIHWVTCYVIGVSMSFSQFFGAGQNIVYYLPMGFGLIYYLFFFLSKNETFAKYIGKDRFNWLIALFTILAALVQAINYFRFVAGL